MGTSRMMEQGRARERKTGTSRYPGVVRRGRKCRNSSNTKVDITRRESMAKMSEPNDDEAAMLGEMGEGVTIRQPRVDGVEVEGDGTDERTSRREDYVEWAVLCRAIG
jgi:hypothetical protein